MSETMAVNNIAEGHRKTRFLQPVADENVNFDR